MRRSSSLPPFLAIVAVALIAVGAVLVYSYRPPSNSVDFSLSVALRDPSGTLTHIEQPSSLVSTVWSTPSGNYTIDNGDSFLFAPAVYVKLQNINQPVTLKVKVSPVATYAGQAVSIAAESSMSREYQISPEQALSQPEFYLTDPPGKISVPCSTILNSAPTAVASKSLSASMAVTVELWSGGQLVTSSTSTASASLTFLDATPTQTPDDTPNQGSGGPTLNPPMVIAITSLKVTSAHVLGP